MTINQVKSREPIAAPCGFYQSITLYQLITLYQSIIIVTINSYQQLT
ncbi:Uncharacterized protein YP598_1205 [Yersinia pseudotuberculosis]|uniref:Uncharacterized protein n=1 Tax=Yersinia pseudotuberculosis serotype O:1b (strain IP 31758) TaxID=349747 RepID=A0A0U1QZ07_YERP3|nr:hypothetical protein YpsIP31758_1180 [Yersinia pseudotuberculosis IP 31758]UFA60828.1 Uncharacterized protein YP598_1205 [Yersinia pseudotuberculosis]